MPKSTSQQLREQKAKNKELAERVDLIYKLLSVQSTQLPNVKVEEKGNGNGDEKHQSIEDTVPVATLPPQPLPEKTGIFKRKVKTTKVEAIVIKPSGVFIEKVKDSELPADARLWRYENRLVYSLIEYTEAGGWFKLKKIKYDLFEPTGESDLLPEKLWRAVKASPIRKVFTYKDKRMEKLNMGLGIAFVVTCIVVLFIIAQTMIPTGG